MVKQRSYTKERAGENAIHRKAVPIRTRSVSVAIKRILGDGFNADFDLVYPYLRSLWRTMGVPYCYFYTNKQVRNYALMFMASSLLIWRDASSM